MRRSLQIAVAALALGVATPASAQFTFLSPDTPPPPLRLEGWSNVLRVNLGAGFYNAGWYNCWAGWGPCEFGSVGSWIPFVVGAQFDLNLGGPSNLALGFTVGMGALHSTFVDTTTGETVQRSAQVTLWEPTLDYVLKLGSPTQDTVPRFRIGGGLYIGPESKVGGSARIGAGVSFFNASRLGVGFDLVLEGGNFNGAWIGGLQLLASPELHF